VDRPVEAPPPARGSPSSAHGPRLGNGGRTPGDAGSRLPPPAPARPGRTPPGSGVLPRTSSDSLPQSIIYRKLLTQSPESACGPGLDGAQWHACSFGYLPLGEPPKIGQLYYLPVRCVERLQGPRHPPRKPGFVYHLLRTGRRIPGSSDVWGPIRDLADLAGTLAVEINGGATRDPVKPGGEAAARRIEGTRRTPHLQEDILDQLLRRGAVTEDLQAHTEDRAAVTIVELGEGYLDFRSFEVSHKLLV